MLVPFQPRRRRDLPFGGRPRRSWRSLRGFSLMEMMAVVAIIGILVALATPMFIGVLRDRRANADTMTIAEMYRLARNRSMGRGAATLVRYQGGTWTMFEAIVASTPIEINLPTSSCINTDWAAGGNNRRISAFNGPSANVEVRYYDDANVLQPAVDVCFTPRGRTYIGPPGGPLVPMTSVSRYETQRLPLSENQRTRNVFIAPNGVARIQL
jgi:prepilin-type N-terminal cleavage/methylation domain-containing protein